MRVPWLGRRGLIVQVLAGATLLGIATGAAASGSSADRTHPFESGALRLAFVHDGGSDQRAPYFDVTGAHPGMRPEEAVITVQNRGTLAASYTVSSSSVLPSGQHSLDDVLVVTVEDGSSGKVVYHGRLSGFSFRGSGGLPPGGSDIYTVSITWPETSAGDNGYQGRSISFAVSADAGSTAASRHSPHDLLTLL